LANRKIEMPSVHKLDSKQRGASLIEILVAMVVLTVGLVGSIALVAAAIGSNARSKSDSTSAALVHMFIGQISAVPISGPSPTVTDCAGNTSAIGTAGSPSGNGANLAADGTIDFTQQFSTVPVGYGVQYTVCNTSTGAQTLYDVRWNITTTPSRKEELVVVGAQLSGGNSSANARLYAPPVNVRTVVGNQGN
jgi:Tfp pilus assembly protein PilV